MKWLFALVPAVFLAACATQPGVTSEERFKQADANGDGVVSRSEATDIMIAEAFARFDTNNDGFVDEAEFVAAGGTAEAFKKHNASGTGKLTLAEAQASPAAIERMALPFDEADVNKNGAITYEELVAYRERLYAAVR